MAAVSLPDNLDCSPRPPLATDLSIIEEGKGSPSQASTVSTIVSPTCAHKIIAELLGTYVIVFIGCGAVIIDQKYGRLNSLGMAITWGLVVMVMVYSLGHISGANFNPAVTIAIATFCKFPWRQVPAYVASQLAGSTLAILSLSALFSHHDPKIINATVTEYKIPITSIEAIAWEFIISFILMLTVCGVATDSRGINELSGVTVGAAVLFNFLLAGNITGASMNPARSVGPALVSGKFKGLWVYIVAPILGTITATFLYSLLWLPTPEKFDKENTKSI